MKHELITIQNNETLIVDFIRDMIVIPRQQAHKWYKITNQTPNLKIGYPAQHLASLIVGMKGSASGARGNDIIDGSEVKSCSKVDQLDKCKDCGEGLLRSQSKCPICSSEKIKRNNDSKWLIGIKNEDELNMALNETPRFIFIVTDYHEFEKNNFDDIRIRAFEINPTSERCKKFRELLENYYYHIYLEHIKINPNKTPAPKNIFPDNFPFYMCNPIKIFECCIINGLSDKECDIQILKYVLPTQNRQDLESEIMPEKLLNQKERQILIKKGFDISKGINEEMRNYLPLRDTDKLIKIIGNKKHK